MAANSTMMPLGTEAPAFELTDVVSGTLVRFHDQPVVATLVAFICNHCPYVVHIIQEFVAVAAEAQKRGIRVLAISSNDVTCYPQDSPENMKEFAAVHRFTFPYLFDETQQVAKAYQAACTPDLYLFDADNRCVYRGRFDASTPGNGRPVTGEDIRDAIDSIVNGQPVSTEQFPSIGCSIKWRLP